eukprot:2226683-Amphidinium_carterae.1
MNVFLGKETSGEKKFKNHVSSLVRALRKRPACCTGRQIFLQELMEGVTSVNKDRAVIGKQSKSHKRVMETHGLLWRKMDSARRAGYETRARHYQGGR